MSKRLTKVLSLVLTLVMFLSVSTPAFAIGGGDMGRDFGRDIGENEIRDFEPAGEITEEEELDYFQTTVEANGSQVTVEAPMGALPTLAELRAEPVISFWLNGIEIEPEEPVRVKISAPELEGKTNLTLVHIPDAAEPETVDLIDEGDLSFALGTNEIAFQADSFSIYVITGDDGLETPRVTYYFLSEIKADGTADPYTFVNKAGEYVDYQIVKEGSSGWEKLQDPGEPVVGLEKNFLGWFVVDENDGTYSFPEDGQPIVFDDNGEAEPPVKTNQTEGDKIVYVAPRYGQAFIVTFWDKQESEASSTNPQHIVTKRVVYLDEGAKYSSVRVDDVSVPTLATQALTGWVSYDYKEVETKYTITQKPVWDEVTKSFNLYPIFSDGHWLRFSGGPSGSGAGYRSAIFVTDLTEASEITSLGTITREGYTFQGWFFNGFDSPDSDRVTNNSGVVNDPAGLLSTVKNAEGDTVLYAHWQGNQVTFKVATWFENADDDDEVFGELTTQNGTAGLMTSVTAPSVTGFTAQTIEQQVIKGDGTTIVNIHYKRNVYNIYFHSTRRNIESNIIQDLTITAKYGADIHDQWPSYKGESAAWYIATSGSTFVIQVTTMPLNGGNYYRYSAGNTYVQDVFRVQSVEGGNTFIDYNIARYPGSTDISNTAEDYTAIKGFRLNAYSQSDANSIRNGGGDPDATYDNRFERSDAIGTTYRNSGHVINNTRSVLFYYLRNQYSVSFNLQKSTNNPSTLTGIYYEANIASVKANEIAALNNQYKIGETELSVQGEGTYVFQGWYDNADCMGDRFNFDQKMPAGNITLFAKWERVYYLIQIDPNGGEILPDVDEVTYTWLQYGEKVERYNIRRDFVEAESGYNGQKYYYCEVLATDDEHRHDEVGYYYKGLRKGFYVKEDLANDKDAFMAAYPQYAGDYADSNWAVLSANIDTSVAYKVATTDDLYSFVGWYKADINDDDTLSYTNEVYDFGGGITGDTAIYAKWRRAGLYQIQYHTENHAVDNEGKVHGFINNSLVETEYNYADQAATKIAYTPNNIVNIGSTEKKSYVFVGWKLAKADGFDPQDPGSAQFVSDKLYNQGDEFVVDARYADGGHFLHLVAFYEPADVNPDTMPVTTVTFNPNFPDGATGTSGQETKYEGVPLNTAIDLSKDSFTYTVIENGTETEKTCAIPTFTWTGYTLIGWNHDQAEAAAGTVEFKLNDTVGVDNANPKDNTLYAVWERQHFYVFHSFTGELEAIEFPTDGSKVNLTAMLSDGTLYGGYFKAYLGNTEFATEENKAAAVAAEGGKTVITDKTYNASATYLRINDKITLFWSKAQAYTTEKGSELAPVAETVYYLREVPNYFLGFRLQYVYDWYYGNRIDNLFLMTSLDNNVYKEAGFAVAITSPGDKQAKFYASYKIAIDDPNSDKDAYSVTINAESINKHKGGLVGVWDGVNDLVKNVDKGSKFSVLPYWITLDGIRVDDPLPVRTFDIGDKTIGDTGLSEVTKP